MVCAFTGRGLASISGPNHNLAPNMPAIVHANGRRQQAKVEYRLGIGYNQHDDGVPVDCGSGHNAAILSQATLNVERNETLVEA